MKTTSIQSRFGIAVSIFVVTVGSFLVGSVQGVGATTHPTYPLGNAKSCKAHYVKRTERHKIGDKEVRYVACVYVAPSGTATTTTTAAPPKLPATATNANASTIGLGVLLGSAETHCIYCYPQVGPNGGQETISLVASGSGQIFGTWTTATVVNGVYTIEWSIVTSGSNFVLTLTSTSTPWSGPLTIQVPTLDQIGGVSIRASFSGSSNLAGSTSTASEITFL